MSHSSNSRNSAHGTSFLVQDCYVWSEIYYLDSATDYREYLPQNARHSGFGELIMLDSMQNFVQHRSNRLSSIRARLVTLLFGCLALALLIGIALESF
jgi:hypothetical protein